MPDFFFFKSFISDTLLLNWHNRSHPSSKKNILSLIYSLEIQFSVFFLLNLSDTFYQARPEPAELCAHAHVYVPRLRPSPVDTSAVRVFLSALNGWCEKLSTTSNWSSVNQLQSFLFSFKLRKRLWSSAHWWCHHCPAVPLLTQSRPTKVGRSAKCINSDSNCVLANAPFDSVAAFDYGLIYRETASHLRRGGA